MHDVPGGDMVRHTGSNRLSCPYLLGAMGGYGVASALPLRPPKTRFTLAVLGAVAISDFPHQRYATLNGGRKLAQRQRKYPRSRTSARTHDRTPRGLD